MGPSLPIKGMAQLLEVSAGVGGEGLPKRRGDLLVFVLAGS